MTLRCPNCGAPWTAPTNTCDNCGATFISSRARAREVEAIEQVDYQRTFALIAGSAAGAAWGTALVFTFGTCLLGRGPCGQMPSFFKIAIAHGPVPWLAWTAIFVAIASLLLARGRGSGWVGLLCSGLLLLLRLH